MPEMDEFDSDSKDGDNFIDLDYYRKIVKNYIDLRRYRTALFWAEKVVALSKHDPNDVYWMAQCMFLLREYHRAAHIIRLRGLEKTHALCHYLAVESLLEAKEYPEAMKLLNQVDLETMTTTEVDGTTYTMIIDEQQKPEILASIYLLKGKVLEAMDNRTMAMDFYVQALQLSVYCTEALELLSQHEMLMAWEERNLLTNLPFNQQCSDAEAEILRKVYKTKLKKYYEAENHSSDPTKTPVSNLPPNLPSTIQSIRDMTEKLRMERESDTKVGRQTSKLFTPIQQNILAPAQKILQDLKTTPSYSIQVNLSKSSIFSDSRSSLDGRNKTTASSTAAQSKSAMSLMVGCDRIKRSLDVMVAHAEKRFYNCEYKQCMKILDDVLKEDPYHTNGITVLIGCLVELKESNKLFYVAHKLVDLYPDQAISWYAVGCYYDIIGKSDPARRYLSKATSLDRLFGPAWLAYGHSFAKENEHDQAMAAYFKATQLMRGCHLPLLYIGVECGMTKNLDLAEKFFYQAMAIAPLDVFVLHELGVIRFEYEFFDSAEDIFRTTLDMVMKMSKQNGKPISSRWEPLLNNLGHCCRKNKKYDDALKFHQRALVLRPQKASTYTCIGFVQALMGNLDDAIESLHRSLAIKRDDIVTSALLKFCIEDQGDDNSLPDSIMDTEAKDQFLQPRTISEVMNAMNSNAEGSSASSSSAAAAAEAVKSESLEIKMDEPAHSEDTSSDMSMDM